MVGVEDVVDRPGQPAAVAKQEQGVAGKRCCMVGIVPHNKERLAARCFFTQNRQCLLLMAQVQL